MQDARDDTRLSAAERVSWGFDDVAGTDRASCARTFPLKDRQTMMLLDGNQARY